MSSLEPFLRVCPLHLLELTWQEIVRNEQKKWIDEYCYCQKCPESLDYWAVWSTEDRCIVDYGYISAVDPRWEGGPEWRDPTGDSLPMPSVQSEDAI